MCDSESTKEVGKRQTNRQKNADSEMKEKRKWKSKFSRR